MVTWRLHECLQRRCLAGLLGQGDILHGKQAELHGKQAELLCAVSATAHQHLIGLPSCIPALHQGRWQRVVLQRVCKPQLVSWLAAIVARCDGLQYYYIFVVQ